VAEDMGLGKHDDPSHIAQSNTLCRDDSQDLLLEGGPGGRRVEVLIRSDIGESAEPRGDAGACVEVDQPLLVPVSEGIPDRPIPHVVHPPHDHRRKLRETTSLLRGRLIGRRIGCCATAHHDTPSASAAATPDRQPSSWNPQP